MSSFMEQEIMAQPQILAELLARLVQKNEIMIVLDSDSMLTDIVLAYLGYYSQDEFLNIKEIIYVINTWIIIIHYFCT